MDTGKLLTLGGLAVGGYFAYKYLLPAELAPAAAGSGGPLALLPAGSSVASAPGVTPVETSPVPPAAPSLYPQLVAAVSGDTNFTGSGDSTSGSPYHWNFYLARLLGRAAPDPAVVFPGVDLSQPMTAVDFWAKMGPVAAGGLSGFLAGLGGIARGLGLGDLPLFSTTVYGTADDGGLPPNMDTGPQSGPVITAPLPAIMGGSDGGYLTRNVNGQPIELATSTGNLTNWLNSNVLLVAAAAVFGVVLFTGRR